MDCAVTKLILLPRALAARKVYSRCRYVNKRKLIEEENPLSSFANIANFYQRTIFLQSVFIRLSRISPRQDVPGHAEDLEDFGNQHGMEVLLFHVVGSFVGLVTVSAEMLGPFGDIDDTERHIAVLSSEEREEIVLAAGRRGTGHYALVHSSVM